VTVTTYAAITGTWNPADKAAAVTLSGGNLIASSNPTTVGSAASVRGTVSKSATQWVWELTLGRSYLSYFGAATSGQSLTGSPLATTTAWVWSTNYLVHNGVSTSVGPFADGDVVAVAFDGDADTLSFYKNGVRVGGFTGVSGTILPFFGAFEDGGPDTRQATANFAGTFTYNYDQPSTPATGTPVIADPEVTVPASFTYTVAGAPSTPATGTITASTDGGMVPGIAYINGYFNVMDTNGVVWSSASDDPTTWGALDFITAQNENGAGRAIAKSQNYLIALKEWSTEFFYDAANPVGSPFSPVDNGFTQVGCASGDSVKSLDGGLMWLSQTKQLGRSVHRMVGLDVVKVSTPAVDRILNADDLATVRAISLTIDGHSIYVLTLETSDISLAYDLTSETWTEWSSLSGSGAGVAVTSITLDGTTATVTCGSAHGREDGDPLLITGADQAAYNGFQQISYVSTTVFTYQVVGSLLHRLPARSPPSFWIRRPTSSSPTRRT
jgi:hypothetical protein